MTITKTSIFLLLSVFLFSCGAKKKAAKQNQGSSIEYNKDPNEEAWLENTNSWSEGADQTQNRETIVTGNTTDMSTTERYIYRFAPVAKNEMKLYGIPASITLAQAILESGSGQAELCQKSNNHFGIKCHGWDGPKVYHDDDRQDECFRKYKDPKYSFRDHSLFLSSRGRYAFLFDLSKTDYKAWARGLKKAGYATDPRYPRKLIDLIERYKLYRFDQQVLNGSGSYTRSDYGNNTSTYTVEDEDTLYSISQQFGMSVSQLKELNNLQSDHIEIGQVLLVK